MAADLVPGVLGGLALSGLAGWLGVLLRRRTPTGRVHRAAAGWATLDLGTVRVCHPPAALDAVVGDRLGEMCREEVARLAGWFGAALPTPPTIYLFPTRAEVDRLTGGMGGWAIQPAGVVVLPTDTHPSWLRMCVRHELVHLHSYRFAGSRPPLVEEGLASLLQFFDNDWPSDTLPDPARWEVEGLLAGLDSPPLRQLLNYRGFHHHGQRLTCYIASASFTAFLVRRHGWATHLAFYKQARLLLFHRRFRRAFGQTLRDAEREWRAGAWAVPPPAAG